MHLDCDRRLRKLEDEVYSLSGRLAEEAAWRASLSEWIHDTFGYNLAALFPTPSSHKTPTKTVVVLDIESPPPLTNVTVSPIKEEFPQQEPSIAGSSTSTLPLTTPSSADSSLSTPGQLRNSPPGTPKKKISLPPKKKKIVVTVERPKPPVRQRKNPIPKVFSDGSMSQSESEKEVEPEKRRKPRPRGKDTPAEMKKIPCKTGCPNRCGLTWTEPDRRSIFDLYWSKKEFESKRTWIREHVKRCPVRRKRSLDSNFRVQTFKYFLPGLDGVERQVCKGFFLATLGLGNCFLDYNVLRTYDET